MTNQVAVFTACLVSRPGHPTATLRDISYHVADVARRTRPTSTTSLIGYGAAADLDLALRTVAAAP